MGRQLGGECTLLAGAEAAARDAYTACPDPVPEVGDGARAEGDVHERVLLEDPLALRLGVAAADRDHPLGVALLEDARVPEVRREPRVRLLADRARVEDEHVGLLRRRRLAEPELLEQTLDPLGIVRVHLAPERGHVVALHACDGSGMEILRPATEDEVLECFVLAERDSERYGETVRKLLERVRDNPGAVLSAYRAWPDQGLFMDSLALCAGTAPGDQERAARDPLHQLGLVAQADERHPPPARRRGEPAGGRGDRVIAKAAAENPPLIAVRAPGSYLVLLEGHVRLTAYATFPEHVPDELEIYLGESPRMREWCQY